MKAYGLKSKVVASFSMTALAKLQWESIYLNLWREKPIYKEQVLALKSSYAGKRSKSGDFKSHTRNVENIRRIRKGQKSSARTKAKAEIRKEVSYSYNPDSFDFRASNRWGESDKNYWETGFYTSAFDYGQDYLLTCEDVLDIDCDLDIEYDSEQEIEYFQKRQHDLLTIRGEYSDAFFNPLGNFWPEGADYFIKPVNQEDFSDELSYAEHVKTDLFLLERADDLLNYVSDLMEVLEENAKAVSARKWRSKSRKGRKSL